MESAGLISSPILIKLSAMPCFPGFTPVNMLVQAGRVKGGIVDISVPRAPSFMISLRCFKCPSSIHGSIILQSAPSTPIMINLLLLGVRMLISSYFQLNLHVA